MDNHQPAIPPMPRPDFDSMTDKALTAYFKKNVAYVSADDPRSTRAEMLMTAGRAADRKAEDFLAARTDADQLQVAMSNACVVLAKFPKGPSGLTPDEVKSSPEWQSAHATFQKVFADLRKFNSTYVRRFGDELRHEREFRRAAGLPPR